MPEKLKCTILPDLRVREREKSVLPLPLHQLQFKCLPVFTLTITVERIFVLIYYNYVIEKQKNARHSNEYINIKIHLKRPFRPFIHTASTLSI